jgi:transposase-like protein
MVTTKKRQRLVDMVLNQHVSITRAANRLSLKTITARFIVNKYKNSGTFTVKKSDVAASGQEELNAPESEIKEEEMSRPIG